MAFHSPIICFGQQPSGFFPKGYFVDKVLTARELKKKIGGTIVWFCHDADHDYRETVTKIKTDRYPEGFVRFNINQPTKFEKLFTPLYLKRIKDGWQEETARKLQPIVSKEAWELFKSISVASELVSDSPSGRRAATLQTTTLADNVADFCIRMYRALGWLEGIEVARSSDPAFRAKALDISNQDHYMDIEYKGVIVHARKSDKGYYLDHGGNVKKFIPLELTTDNLKPEKLSPTRDNRFPWMQSVIHCTHYIYGKSEAEYLEFNKSPDVAFIPRQESHEPDFAVVKKILSIML